MFIALRPFHQNTNGEGRVWIIGKGKFLLRYFLTAEARRMQQFSKVRQIRCTLCVFSECFAVKIYHKGFFDVAMRRGKKLQRSYVEEHKIMLFVKKHQMHKHQ